MTSEGRAVTSAGWRRVLLAGAILGVTLAGWGSGGVAQVKDVSPNAAGAVFIPKKPDLTGIVVNAAQLAALGKAFTHDEQVGSDGMACMTCHFHAGADTRTTNLLSPGMKDIRVSGGDVAFGSDRSDTFSVRDGALISGTPAGPNVELQPEDFPLHKLSNPFAAQSAIESTTNDSVSSPGVVKMDFEAVRRLALRAEDRCSAPDAGLFGIGVHSGGRGAVRQTEPRNTPTIINAALFERTFWDVRANNEFNGLDVFGPRTVKADPTRRLIVRQKDGTLALGHLTLRDASLASLAVGPPLSNLEMSCDQRTFADVGRKLWARRPLALQGVHPEDSLLAGLRALVGKGLRGTYAELIQATFAPKYWAADGRYRIVPDGAGGATLAADPEGYTQAEINFSLFFGIAVQEYLARLISDQSEFDTLRAHGRIATFDINQTNTALCSSPTGDVDPLLLKGCTVFAGPGGCTACHNVNQQQGQAGQNRMPMLAVGAVEHGQAFNLVIGGGQRGSTVRIHRDQGVAGTGVRPFFHDLLTGGTDPYGNPLSYMRQLRHYAVAVANGMARAQALETYVVDTILRERIKAGVAFAGVVNTGALGVDGAPKAPMMRNVMLTPPYMHNGSMSTLRQVLEFYNRGGNARNITADNAAVEGADAGQNCTAGDNTGTGPLGDPPGDDPLVGNVTNCGSNTGAGVKELGLVDCHDPRFVAQCAAEGLTPETDDLGAMIRFFAALTDPRVQRNAAPFDGPELHVTVGHRPTDRDGDGIADEQIATIAATGARGFPDGSPCIIPNAGDLFAPGMQGRLEGCDSRLGAPGRGVLPPGGRPAR
jgi:cytochrome c peroxidase